MFQGCQNWSWIIVSEVRGCLVQILSHYLETQVGGQSSCTCTCCERFPQGHSRMHTITPGMHTDSLQNSVYAYLSCLVLGTLNLFRILSLTLFSPSTRNTTQLFAHHSHLHVFPAPSPSHVLHTLTLFFSSMLAMTKRCGEQLLHTSFPHILQWWRLRVRVNPRPQS